MIILNVSHAQLADIQDRDDFDDDDIILDTTQIIVDRQNIIEAYAPFYRVTDENIIAAEGLWCYLEMGNLRPDFSLTLIYNNVPDSLFDPSNWLYWEHDPILTAINNFKNLKAAHTGK